MTPTPRSVGHLGPGSVSARYFGDVRMLAVASRALTLQVAHPVVGAGVAQHSDFAADPWGRLLRTLDTVVPLVYGTPDRAREVGEALRARHRGIVGTDDQGRRYTALDPEAYHWVHATLLDAVLTASKVFGPSIPRRDLPRLYEEYKVAADYLTIDPRQVPDTLSDFREYVRDTIEHRLEHTATVDEVSAVIDRPVAPDLVPSALRGVWPLAWMPVAQVVRVSHVALLPRRLRKRFGLRLTTPQRLEFQALAGAIRVGFAAVPSDLRLLPQVRRELRQTRAAA